MQAICVVWLIDFCFLFDYPKAGGNRITLKKMLKEAFNVFHIIKAGSVTL